MECIESIFRNLDTSTPTCIRWGILFSQQMSKSKLKDKTMGKGKRGKSDTQVKMLWLCGPLAWNLKNNLFKGQCVQHGKTSWFNTVCSSLPYFISIIIHRVLYFLAQNSVGISHLTMHLKLIFNDVFILLLDEELRIILYFT